MWKKIDNIQDLEKYKQSIQQLFNKHGQIYSQHFLSLKASMLSNNNFIIYLDIENLFLLALEKTNLGYYKSCIQGYPILGLNKKNISLFAKSFIQLKKILTCSTIYFPHVYESNLLNKIELKSEKIITWARSPNPIFDKTISSKEIYKQIVNRYGSRTKRQKNKFEKKLHTAKAKKEDIKKIIKTIEKKSWKNKCKQDMISREQFNYYINIIDSGLAKLKVAYDGKKPIAYRIDSKINNILYTIKWSFDENYKKYSPGFYLLTFDLFNDYENDNLDYIDLYGGPDSLKDLIETKRIKRSDICITSDLITANKIKKERQSFDSIIIENYKKSNSIRSPYIKNAKSKK